MTNSRKTRLLISLDELYTAIRNDVSGTNLWSAVSQVLFELRLLRAFMRQGNV